MFNAIILQCLGCCIVLLHFNFIVSLMMNKANHTVIFSDAVICLKIKNSFHKLQEQLIVGLKIRGGYIALE